MPYYSQTDDNGRLRIYYVEEVSHVPNGYRAEPVPTPRPATPQPQPQRQPEPDIVSRWESAQREARLNHALDKVRREATAASAPRSAPTPVPRPEPKPTVRHVDKVIDPYVR